MKYWINLFLLVSVQAFSQTWSEPPIIISTGACYNPDFVIDYKGNIHCVWEQSLTDHYSKVYYSKSTDEGLTWSIPVPITKNESRWLDHPHIECDSKNNLFVSYDYDVDGWPKIAYIKFDSELNTWSEQFILDYGEYNAITVDHLDRVYFFWTKATTYYRVLVGDSLSDIMQPYSKDTVLCSFQSIGVDSENGLHIIGARKHNLHLHTAYFVFKEDSWKPYMDISDKGAVQSSIVISANNQPSFFWTQPLLDSAYHIGSFFASYDGGTFTPLMFLDTIATGPTLFYNENHQAHFVEGIEDDGLFFLVDKKTSENGFDCDTIESNAFPYDRNICHTYDSSCCLIYHRVDTSWSSLPNTHNSNIIFRKLNIINGIFDLHKTKKISIFPNPFTESLCIELPYPIEQIKSVEIFDLSGNKVVHMPTLQCSVRGQKYSITLSEDVIKKLPKGYYVIKISTNNTIFKSLVFHK